MNFVQNPCSAPQSVELNEVDLIVIEGDPHPLLRDGKHPIAVVV